MKKYAVMLEVDKFDTHFFVDGGELFTLEEARKQVTFFERLYSANKGEYKIVEIKEVA